MRPLQGLRRLPNKSVEFKNESAYNQEIQEIYIKEVRLNFPLFTSVLDLQLDFLNFVSEGIWRFPSR